MEKPWEQKGVTAASADPKPECSPPLFPALTQNYDYRFFTVHTPYQLSTELEQGHLKRPLTNQERKLQCR